uniref:GTP-binding protein n=1 Tax=Syphacia muris TaxID=451379 RepID=A0A158R5K9_9BILA
MPDEGHRLVVLGSSKVGKTSIIRQFLNKEFSEKYKETVEDIYSKRIKIRDKVIPLEILDTNFNFPDMRKVAITSASAFLLVFAVDNVQSFKEMSDLWNEICESRTNIRDVPTVVAGNKSDLPTKKIFEATATAWTSRLNANIRYLETSAKTAQNITNVFRTLLEISGLTFLKVLFLNLKLQIKSKKPEKNEEEKGANRGIGSENTLRLGRSKSLIRRTKHLSLKIRKSGDKQLNNNEEDGDCRVS